MKVTIFALATLVPVLATAAEPFTHSGRFDSVGGQSTLVSVVELSRTATTSVVRVTGTAPVPALHSRYVGLAVCSLAKARLQRYFQVRRLDGDLETYEVSFPQGGPEQAPAGSFPGNASAPNSYPVSACA